MAVMTPLTALFTTSQHGCSARRCERLTPDQRDVILLRFVARMTGPEIARSMGKTAAPSRPSNTAGWLRFVGSWRHWATMASFDDRLDSAIDRLLVGLPPSDDPDMQPLLAAAAMVTSLRAPVAAGGRSRSRMQAALRAERARRSSAAGVWLRVGETLGLPVRWGAAVAATLAIALLFLLSGKALPGQAQYALKRGLDDYCRCWSHASPMQSPATTLVWQNADWAKSNSLWQMDSPSRFACWKMYCSPGSGLLLCQEQTRRCCCRRQSARASAFSSSFPSWIVTCRSLPRTHWGPSAVLWRPARRQSLLLAQRRHGPRHRRRLSRHRLPQRPYQPSTRMMRAGTHRLSPRMQPPPHPAPSPSLRSRLLRPSRLRPHPALLPQRHHRRRVPPRLAPLKRRSLLKRRNPAPRHNARPRRHPGRTKPTSLRS